MFLLMLMVAVCKSDVWLKHLSRRNSFCLKESKMKILQWTERSMVRVMCGMQLKDKEAAKDLMLIFGLNETICQLPMTYSASQRERSPEEALQRLSWKFPHCISC